MHVLYSAKSLLIHNELSNRYLIPQHDLVKQHLSRNLFRLRSVFRLVISHRLRQPFTLPMYADGNHNFTKGGCMVYSQLPLITHCQFSHMLRHQDSVRKKFFNSRKKDTFLCCPARSGTREVCFDSLQIEFWPHQITYHRIRVGGARAVFLSLRASEDPTY